MSERPGTMRNSLAASPAASPAAMPPGASAAARAAPPMWLYGAAVFAAAWLVFWVQPLGVRGVLPVLGGSPAVWNTAMVFFQAALLGGYALAHLLARRATPAGQLVVLGCLWAGVALTAPIGELRILGEAPAGLPPALWLLGTLAGALGIAPSSPRLVPHPPRPELARASRGGGRLGRPLLPLRGLERGLGRGAARVSFPPRALPRAGAAGLGLERRGARARAPPLPPVAGRRGG